jgi:undecaprenyl-diphosphatase
MTTLKAVLLGLVQGLTEFLPVSSSGHLVLGQHLFGLTEPELLFDVVVHLGTLIAVLTVYYGDVARLTAEFVRLPRTLAGGWRAAWADRPMFRLLILVLAGSVPTGLIGVLFKDAFEVLFGSTLAVGFALMATGTILLLTRRLRPTGRPLTGMTGKDALVVGLVQGLAITPGVSRSGITISTGLLLGLDRELAARFSFLLFVPAILGALVLELADASAGSFGPPALVAGFLAALISGLAALRLLLRVVRRGALHYFAYYCYLLGAVVIGVSLWA